MKFYIITYIVMGLITSTLALVQILMANSRNYRGSDEIAEYTFKSIGKGMFWPITIWVALVCWWASDTTPHWVEILKSPYSFISEKIKLFSKKENKDVGRI